MKTLGKTRVFTLRRSEHANWLPRLKHKAFKKWIAEIIFKTIVEFLCLPAQHIFPRPWRRFKQKWRENWSVPSHKEVSQHPKKRWEASPLDFLPGIAKVYLCLLQHFLQVISLLLKHKLLQDIVSGCNLKWAFKKHLEQWRGGERLDCWMPLTCFNQP